MQLNTDTESAAKLEHHREKTFFSRPAKNDRARALNSTIFITHVLQPYLVRYLRRNTILNNYITNISLYCSCVPHPLPNKVLCTLPNHPPNHSTNHHLCVANHTAPILFCSQSHPVKTFFY